MKRIHWWTLAVVGACVAANVVGQTVWGQPGGAPLPKITTRPDFPVPAPIPEPPRTPIGIPLPELKSVAPLPLITTAPVSTTPTAPASTTPTAPASTMPLLSRGGDPAMSTLPILKLEKETGDVRSGKQQPSVSLEWVGPQAARVNQPMPCQLLVRNTSNAAVQNVVVRQKLPQGITCKGSDPQAVNEAGELVWNLGTLAPDQTRRVDVQLVAQTRGTLNCQATVTFTGSANHEVQVREPQLAIKMRAPDKVVVDEPVVLLFAVSNPGDGTAESVKVKVLLPEGLEYKGGRVAEVEVGNLAPRDIRTMQLPCQAKGSGMQKCLVIATADGGVTANDNAQLEILIPKLEVVMSGPKLRYLDRPAVYVVKVTNPGSAPVAGVELQEVIPAGFKFTQANHGGLYQEATRTVSWTLGDLQPGQSKDVTVDVVPIDPGEHRMIAHARAGRGLKIDTEVRTLVEGLPSLLIELANADNPVEVGTETAYQLRVINTGTKTETGIEVTCTLPEQFEFKGAKCNTTLRYRLEGRQLVFEPLARLAPKADVIYHIQVRGTAAGDVRCRARIKSDGMREAVVREEGTRIYSDESLARPQPNLTPRSAPPATSAPLSPAPTLLNGPEAGAHPITAPTSVPALPTPANSKPAPLPAPGRTGAPTTPTMPPLTAEPAPAIPTPPLPLSPVPAPEAVIPAPQPPPSVPAPKQ